MMDPETRDQVDRRLKRIAGQVAGIQRMVTDDRYCVDILMQVAAVRAALGKVSQLVLDSHIQTCVSEAFESGDPSDREAKIAELIRVFDRNCRC
jgi:DNA-binding FrmR family transcriptional regulator